MNIESIIEDIIKILDGDLDDYNIGIGYNKGRMGVIRIHHMPTMMTESFEEGEDVHKKCLRLKVITRLRMLQEGLKDSEVKIIDDALNYITMGEQE